MATASTFDRAFQLERARADRNGNSFSLAVFLPGRGGDRQDFQRLVRVLRNRVRATDTVGVLDPNRLGVLLPETSSQGAWTFADDVLARLARIELAFDCEVFTYPVDWPQRLETRHAVGDGVDASSNGQHGGTGVPYLVTRSPSSDDGLAHVRASLGRRPVSDMSAFFVRPMPPWKRAMDILLSVTLLLLLSPLMLLVALAIKLTSPGPVIFRQPRAGLGGKPFTFLKFRSMYVDAEERRKALEGQNEVSGPVFKMRNDPRITPVGRVLRRLSIDEIPQLWNVLRGDMTLVGPRPPILDEVRRYEPWQRHRLDTTGGLTCVWQVSGRSTVEFIDWMRMDMQYIARRSLLFDLSLLARTARAVISRRGAY